MCYNVTYFLNCFCAIRADDDRPKNCSRELLFRCRYHYNKILPFKSCPALSTNHNDPFIPIIPKDMALKIDVSCEGWKTYRFEAPKFMWEIQAYDLPLWLLLSWYNAQMHPRSRGKFSIDIVLGPTARWITQILKRTLERTDGYTVDDRMGGVGIVFECWNEADKRRTYIC